MTINAWLAYVIGGAFAILLGAIAVLLVINADQRATLAASDAARSLLVSENKNWAQKAARTDAALARIKAEDAANAKAIARAEAKAAEGAKALQDEAHTIAALHFSGNDCAQVTAITRAYWEQFK